ncbi:tetratricopeptide repeat protein [Marinobacter sp. GN3S48]|uniref:tetratricopeptide repeat protein n=1 Tax=Marinobacter sp. GN3S48 TaxID=3382302 RepID=UPI00387B4B64
MRYIAALLFGLFLAGTVAASQCPSLVAKVDSQLESAELDSATVDNIKALRDQGQTLHEQGKHDESVKVLKEALSMFPDKS